MMLTNEPLSKYTYMKVGGPADYLTIVNTSDELVTAITETREKNQRFIIIGGGSNTFFTDQGFRGVVIVNHANDITIDNSTGTVIVDSGAATNAVVAQVNQAGLGGLAEFFGVPGSIGGAIYNNAHYLRKFIGSYVVRVELLNSNNERYWLNQSELDFKYDYSRLQEIKEPIITIEFKLDHENAATLQQIAKEAIKRRHNSQPLELPSSGCMFQNPPNAAAGALIDQAGLKNKTIGGARVSEKHANFIVNDGNATAQDIIDLSNEIITEIKQKFGISLQREVFILDQFGERIDA